MVHVLGASVPESTIDLEYHNTGQILSIDLARCTTYHSKSAPNCYQLQAIPTHLHLLPVNDSLPKCCLASPTSCDKEERFLQSTKQYFEDMSCEAVQFQCSIFKPMPKVDPQKNRTTQSRSQLKHQEMYLIRCHKPRSSHFKNFTHLSLIN